MQTELLPSRWRRVLDNRCFFLFLALLALLLATPFLATGSEGKKLIGTLNVLILVAAVVAVENSKLSLAFATFLGLPALGFQILAVEHGQPGYWALCWSFGAAFYAYTIARLLHYVLRKDVMTADKLYGAVAAYLMIGIFWAFMHGVLQYFHPGAYLLHGTPQNMNMASDLIYFSFTALTSTGFGDITPALIHSRYLTILESMTGVMYVAILIARLTGVYPVTNAKD